MTIITRKEYLDQSHIDGLAAHRAYHAQFVTDSTRAAVLRAITLPRLLASTDPHLNDIPLHEWDRIGAPVYVKRLKEAGDYLTKAGYVCIVKEAARQLIELHNEG